MIDRAALPPDLVGGVAHDWARTLPILALALPLLAIAVLLSEPAEASWEGAGLVLAVSLGALGSLVARRAERTEASAHFFAGSLLATALVALPVYGGVESAAGVSVLTGVIVAGVLLGRRALLLAGLLASLVVAACGFANSSGGLDGQALPGPLISTATLLGNIAMVCLVGVLGQRIAQRAASRANRGRRIDPTTGLLVRAGFEAALRDRLDEARASGGEDALLLLQVDRFDLVHQSHGRAVSDPLLVAVAERLAAAVRPVDLLGKLEGGSFGVAIAGLDGPRQLQAEAARLKVQLDRAVELEGVRVVIAVHVGAASLRPAHESEEHWLRDASTALAHVGAEAGTFVRVYEPGLSERARRALELDAALEVALGAGQLTPFYQPIVHLESGELAGFEALVRWELEDGGFVSPADFVPRAEETGLIVEIDRTVLRQACEQLAAWRSRYPDRPVWVSVNLSARQFQAEGLVEAVRSTLLATGVPPASLHLELTESALTVDVEHTRRVLAEIKELGVALLIDDFGTGWSSMAYVQSYPVDILKIDRAFVRGITDAGGDELAATIRFMARALGLAVVAEGIETRAQYRRLRELGVEMGQGYHFSRPVPAAGAERWLRPRIPEEPSRAWSSELELPLQRI
jgi:diguanylate cyclase (GGDEF)-like protein